MYNFHDPEKELLSSIPFGCGGVEGYIFLLWALLMDHGYRLLVAWGFFWHGVGTMLSFGEMM